MEDHNDQCVSRSGMLLSAIGTKKPEHIDATVGGPHKNLSGSFNISEQLAKTPGSLPHIIVDISVSDSYDLNGNLVQSLGRPSQDTGKANGAYSDAVRATQACALERRVRTGADFDPWIGSPDDFEHCKAHFIYRLVRKS